MSSREYPSRPLVGVGVLVVHEDKVLLIKRRMDPDKGLWAIPGGLVNLGEKIRDAAAREVLEETGVKVNIKRLIDVVDKIVLDDQGRVKYHFVIVDFEGEAMNHNLNASPEVEEAKWMSKEEIKNIELSETTKDLLVRVGFIKR
ncbi:MAG: NUDIX hydrolase [Candidatus Nezhaarchaeales archaeon]